MSFPWFPTTLCRRLSILEANHEGFNVRLIVIQFVLCAALAAGCFLAPARLLTLFLWTVGGVVAVVLLYLTGLVALFHWKLRHPTPLPDPEFTRMPCPCCGSTEHDYKSQGLWDGMPDPVTGGRPGGSFGFGICKACGSRWAQWDDAQPYVPTEEEWDAWIVRPEEARAEHLRQWTEHHARRT